MTTPMRAVPDGLIDAEIRISGDKVTINNLTITNTELAAYLNLKEGPERALAFSDMVVAAVLVQRLSNTSADVQELNSVAQQVRDTMESAGEDAFDDLEKLIREQTNEQNPAALIALLKTKMITHVIAELDPTKETSPFYAINQRLLELLDKAGGQDAAKQVYANSREKGIDFETLLDQMIQIEAAVHGDDAQFTGETPAPSGDKYGDEVVTINPAATGNDVLRIVWEAKTDKTFKDTKGRLKRDKVASELNNAMTTREADCGIFVSDARGIDLTLQPVWQEFEGNKLIIVLDDEDPDQRLIRLAYLWSRWILLRSQNQLDGEIDVVAIDRVISDLQREFDGLANLKRLHTPIKTNVEAAIKFVADMEEKLDGLMDELRDLIAAAEGAEE